MCIVYILYIIYIYYIQPVVSAEFWQAVLKRPWPLAEVPLNEWKEPQLQLSKLNILVIIYTMFNNTGSSHARRLGLVYGTKIIPNQLKSMIFPQAAPIKTCMTWVKMFLHPNFQHVKLLPPGRMWCGLWRHKHHACLDQRFAPGGFHRFGCPGA